MTHCYQMRAHRFTVATDEVRTITALAMLFQKAEHALETYLYSALKFRTFLFRGSLLGNPHERSVPWQSNPPRPF